MKELVTTFLKPRSYDAAQSIANGNYRNGLPIVQATAIRAAMILPGLILLGMPKREATYGALIGSTNISLSLILYYMLKE